MTCDQERRGHGPTAVRRSGAGLRRQEPRGMACTPPRTHLSRAPATARHPADGHKTVLTCAAPEVPTSQCLPRPRHCPQAGRIPKPSASPQPGRGWRQMHLCDDTHRRGCGHRHRSAPSRRLPWRDHAGNPHAHGSGRPVPAQAEFSAALGDLASPTACSAAVSPARARRCHWGRVDPDPALGGVAGSVRTPSPLLHRPRAGSTQLPV